MNDTAASLQQEYDQAVAKHGEQSPQALEAERQALKFFKGMRAPVTPAVQRQKETSWAS
ncbi:hypothetical protein [Variovorax paradoxus]|uniref:hypothetical protein n=1 Tax=Variovorax paradoxus TaxID=34073 RepID=UPI0030D0CFBA